MALWVAASHGITLASTPSTTADPHGVIDTAMTLGPGLGVMFREVGQSGDWWPQLNVCDKSGTLEERADDRSCVTNDGSTGVVRPVTARSSQSQGVRYPGPLPGAQE